MRLHKASMDKSWRAFKPVRSKAISVLGIGFAVIIFCLTPALANAATDSFSIQEAAGITTSNYPVQMGRPFIQGEIEDYPQVGICSDASCGTVSQWLTTQADVKQHWTDGSVKHAVLSFYIPKLTAHSTSYFKVQNQTNCNCGTGLTQAQMLASNYNFDATEVYTNGVTATISAREILGAWDGSSQGVTGPVYYWAKGVNATTLIIADYRNNQTCNGHACSSNDFGSDANKSLRPEFHVTFWPLTNQVKVRFVGEIVNTEAMQNQNYDVALSLGATAPVTVYTQAGIQQGVAERWTIDRNNQSGQTWTVSTPGGAVALQKETWIGNIPGPIAINHNLAYIETTLFTPNYDTSKTMTEAALESYWSAWIGRTQGIYGNGGFWSPGMGNPGASSWIGPLPGWITPWLYTGDIRAQEIALETTPLEGNYPEHIIEGHPGKNLNRADAANAGTGVGHVVSISNRPTWDSALSLWGYSYTNASDAIHTVGTATDAGWHADGEHQPDFGSVVYALTGDYFFLQEQMFSASWYAGQSNGPATYNPTGRGPTGAEGGIVDDDPRTIAWYVRTESTTAFVTPDADFEAEHIYFASLLNDFIAEEEGARCGSSDLYPWCASSPFHKNPNWIWGYTIRAQINNEAGQGANYPVLHQWAAGNSAFVEGDLDSATSSYGIGIVPGAGAVISSGSSSSVTFSDSTQCAQMHAGQKLFLTADNGGLYGTTISTLSCPEAVLADSLPLTNGGSPWTYAPVARAAVSEFSSDYLLFTLFRAKELGAPTSNLASWLAQYFTGLIVDPNSNPRLAFTGRAPTVDVTTGAYINSYAQLKTAYQPQWRTVSTGYAPPGGTASDTYPATGYAAYAMAAYSYVTGEPNGAVAWAFMAANVLPDSSFNGNPQWAIVPRDGPVSTTPPPVQSANKCDLNGDGVVNVLDVQIATDQVLGTMPCTASGCTAPAVSAITAAAIGGNCLLQ